MNINNNNDRGGDSGRDINNMKTVPNNISMMLVNIRGEIRMYTWAWVGRVRTSHKPQEKGQQTA